MKRPAIIIVVLILLLAIIGFERIGKGFRFVISDDRVARARQADVATNSEDAKSKESSIPERDTSRTASRSQDQDQADTVTTPPIEDLNGPQSVDVRITGEISPIHFVRAAFIVGSTEPSKEQIDRLSKAVNAVAEALRPGAIIFDADGLSKSGAPALLFARDEFDLTDQVKEIYDTMDESSNHPQKEDTEFEQIVDGNAR